jgi:hypothetical protein
VISDLITITITAILTLLMATLLLTYVARNSIPGDFLYGIKGLSENVQLALTLDTKGKTELETEFNQRRIWEMEQLIQQNRAAVVHFWGNLEVKGENIWIIEGYTIQLAEDTAIPGTPQENDLVEVIGLLRTNGTLVADTIMPLTP